MCKTAGGLHSKKWRHPRSCHSNDHPCRQIHQRETPGAKSHSQSVSSTALKAGLRCDERVKRVVGLNVDIDFAFVLENPNPTFQVVKTSSCN